MITAVPWSHSNTELTNEKPFFRQLPTTNFEETGESARTSRVNEALTRKTEPQPVTSLGSTSAYVAVMTIATSDLHVS